MCKKTLRCVIADVASGKFFLGGRTYYKCKCNIAEMEMTVYVSAECGCAIRAGDIVETRFYYLTNDRSGSKSVKSRYPKVIVALRVEDYDVIETGIVGQNVEVIEEGYITKSKKVRLKTVGSTDTPFVPVTFQAHNEDGEEYVLLACCFGEVAKAVDKITKPEKVLIRARLKENRYDGTLELSVAELEFINKN